MKLSKLIWAECPQLLREAEQVYWRLQLVGAILPAQLVLTTARGVLTNVDFRRRPMAWLQIRSVTHEGRHPLSRLLRTKRPSSPGCRIGNPTYGFWFPKRKATET